ncbi:restriction endonuclease [Vibrio splendidus]
MSYDFGRLSFDDFEDLAADILADQEKCRVEVFKKGKDQGIDGRFLSCHNEKCIIQAKHRPEAKISALINEINKTEVHKAQKLGADRYIYFTSTPLNPSDKDKIMAAFKGYIKSTTDIFGKDEIEGYVSRKPEIERTHYKLWLSSVTVIQNIMKSEIIGDSEFTAQEILNESEYYKALPYHYDAIDKLERENVIIITGNPGNGKTTLAKNICLHYIGYGYKLINIGSEFFESSGFLTKYSDVNTIFYFDDFLGRNYLEAMSDRSDSEILKFIRRVQASDKSKFILTSRTNILNRRKSEVEEYDIRKSYEREYLIDISQASNLDKARILYIHARKSSLDINYVRNILEDKFYRTIVEHKNFNPRIIEYLFDASRIQSDNILPSGFKDYILKNLSNPHKIWDICFKKQAEISKFLVCAIAYSGSSGITEVELRNFHEQIKIVNERAKGDHTFDNFEDCIKTILGSMISRTIGYDGTATYDTFNPSINDYIINKYANESMFVADIFSCFDDFSKLRSIVRVHKTGQSGVVDKTIKGIIKNISDLHLEKSEEYLDQLIYLSVRNSQSNQNFKLFSEWYHKYNYQTFTPSNISRFLRNLLSIEKSGIRIIEDKYKYNFINRCIKRCYDIQEVEEISLLMFRYELDQEMNLVNNLEDALDSVFTSDFDSIIADENKLDEFLPGDEYDAEQEADDYLDEILDGLGLPFERKILSLGSSYLDVNYILESNTPDNIYRSHRTEILEDDDDEDLIDDVFYDFEGSLFDDEE